VNSLSFVSQAYRKGLEQEPTYILKYIPFCKLCMGLAGYPSERVNELPLNSISAINEIKDTAVLYSLSKE
jgi:hypothetical protein